jgi:UPF0716 protein FxsA
MRFLAFFALIALAEVATFFWVGSQIGLLWALGLAITTALLGAFLVRRAGLSVLGRIRDRMDQGQLPGRELSDGAAILVAGAFLISPGFITDALGFLLLIPSVRGLIHKMLWKRIAGRMTVFTVNRQTMSGVWADRTGSPGGRRGDVIDIDDVELFPLADPRDERANSPLPSGEAAEPGE